MEIIDFSKYKISDLMEFQRIFWQNNSKRNLASSIHLSEPQSSKTEMENCDITKPHAVQQQETLQSMNSVRTTVEAYEVAAILGKRKLPWMPEVEYLIKWVQRPPKKGMRYPYFKNAWQPKSNLNDGDMLHLFEEKKRQKEEKISKAMAERRRSDRITLLEVLKRSAAEINVPANANEPCHKRAGTNLNGCSRQLKKETGLTADFSTNSRKLSNADENWKEVLPDQHVFGAPAVYNNCILEHEKPVACTNNIDLLSSIPETRKTSNPLSIRLGLQLASCKVVLNRISVPNLAAPGHFDLNSKIVESDNTKECTSSSEVETLKVARSNSFSSESSVSLTCHSHGAQETNLDLSLVLQHAEAQLSSQKSVETHTSLANKRESKDTEPHVTQIYKAPALLDLNLKTFESESAQGGTNGSEVETLQVAGSSTLSTDACSYVTSHSHVGRETNLDLNLVLQHAEAQLAIQNSVQLHSSLANKRRNRNHKLKCSICNSLFPSERQMRTHKKRVHPLFVKYFCMMCLYFFYLHSNLANPIFKLKDLCMICYYLFYLQMEIVKILQD